ncbi:ABC transporter permease [Oceanobacillus bengalensis]|uniref:ABC transporter permease n=1 Tax=Oceanobacillus bengalensis TaxID=1435466 RepID=A0A494YRJ0_9BACI|nr:ABC transporter permease [Oceanobacillus bengalensis]RKQ12089.1 ABC transporter permease [Oceanobacillus bengalensis]
MDILKHILLFVTNNIQQLRRKWLSLPLLFIFPILLVGLICIVIVSFIMPEDGEAIQVGLVDLDKSKETELVTQLIEESSQFGSFMSIHSMDEDKAQGEIGNNRLSAYLVFPENFTNDLYQGNSVIIPIVGNPKQRLESMTIREIIDSISLHIRASQANILAINHYAKEMGMNDEERNDLVFEQFKEFVFYTLGSNQVIRDVELTNLSTASPVHYFGIGAWLLLITIWLLTFYHLLYQENSKRLKQRMKLYGVTNLSEMIARMSVSLIMSMIFSLIVFLVLNHFLTFDLVRVDVLRISGLIFLYSLLFLICLAICETIIRRQKLRLLVHAVFTVVVLIISGAIIPTIYLPIGLQELLAYSFSYESFYWLTEILLNNRLYADFLPLLLMTLAGFFVFIGISLWKERVDR